MENPTTLPPALCYIWPEAIFKSFPRVLKLFVWLIMALKVISAGEFTRSEVGPGGVIVRSCIDHWDTNIPEKLSFPELIAVGSSDQLGIVVKKFTKAAKLKPKIIHKRSYKLFNIEYFLTDILTNNLNEKITACEDLEEAAGIFESSFSEILYIHAPIKKIQVRQNCLRYLSAAHPEKVPGEVWQNGLLQVSHEGHGSQGCLESYSQQDSAGIQTSSHQGKTHPSSQPS